MLVVSGVYFLRIELSHVCDLDHIGVQIIRNIWRDLLCVYSTWINMGLVHGVGCANAQGRVDMGWDRWGYKGVVLLWGSELG